MGNCLGQCKTDAPWKPFVTTTVRNVVVHSLIIEPSLCMVKECGCKKCRRVNKRAPNPEEAMKYNGMLEDVRRSQAYALASTEDSNTNKRKSIAIR